ncbi:RNase III domain-containing protein [Mycena venus]|uniref:RNase III domain-containing protein n=1 Tax=Mycena venus TaxID=2733690 RepID=A0A8H6Z0V8_9AGAR|nr:RNase III domain-containing protein [Mycena venus]
MFMLDYLNSLLTVGSGDALVEAGDPETTEKLEEQDESRMGTTGNEKDAKGQAVAGNEDPEAILDALEKELEAQVVAAGSKSTIQGGDSLRDAIQLAIIVASMHADFQPTFPKLKSDLWNVIEGPIEDRDPLETCGDGAMHVVITELLLAVLKEKPAQEGKRIFKAIHAPLLSNSTFLHVLQSSGFFEPTGGTPKHPGNAFEVFAGTLAIYESLEALKNWISIIFKPLIEAAIKAWADFDPDNISEIPKTGKVRAAEEEREEPPKRRQLRDLRKRVPVQYSAREASTSAVTLDAATLPDDDVEHHFDFVLPATLAWTPIADETLAKTGPAVEHFKFSFDRTEETD